MCLGGGGGGWSLGMRLVTKHPRNAQITIAGVSIWVQSVSILTEALVAADGVVADLRTTTIVVTTFIAICKNRY